MQLNPVLLGIDLGTSSLKCVAISRDGELENLATVPITSHIDGRVHEQDPEEWWLALRSACAIATREGFDLRRVTAIGLTGHMHGTVLVDGTGESLRPCITWADTRAQGEALELRRDYGERFRSITMNDVEVVFTIPKLLWIDRHERGVFKNTRWIVSPKDFLRARLTDVWATDRTDAAGTLLLDVETWQWSSELLEIVGFRPEVMPPVLSPVDVVGAVTRLAQRETGLTVGIPVVVGAGDIACATLGAGMTEPGEVYINIGTAAQVLSIHAGMTAPHRYWLADVSPEKSIHSGTVFGAGLAHSAVASAIDMPDAGSITDRYGEMDRQAREIEFGSGGLMFVPSLGGSAEVGARRGLGGEFTGLVASPVHKYRAVLEGVAFAIQTLLPAGFESIRVGGGIRNSRLWLEILATVLEAPIQTVDHDASPVGAAMLAGVGVGWFESLSDAAAWRICAGRTVYPVPVPDLQVMKRRFAGLACTRIDTGTRKIGESS